MNFNLNTRRCLCGIAIAALLPAPQALFADASAGRGAGSDAADEAMATIRPVAIRADMRFLSDDLLEGRGTATRGHEIAAEFMATQFESLGLEPAGDNGTYFQNVPLRSMRPDINKTSLTLIRDGKEQTLTFGQDYIASGDPARADTSIEAPVVFVGFGVTAPEQGYDDYKGLDVKGKIVALVYGAPNFASSLKAHYSSSEVKRANAAAHGAAGTLGLDIPALEARYPFSKSARDVTNPQFRWLDKNGKPNAYFPELKGSAYLSLSAAERLFAGTAHPADEVFAAVKAGKPMSFALPITARIHNVTTLADAHSPNVVAKLTGSDPLLQGEYLVYTAHLDHLGIGTPVAGDSIYNGALDNASGSATILEIARAFSHMNPRPRRSILFVSVTGEEMGLLGSEYFARYPTVAKNSIVADVNTDEDLMLWPMQDVIAFGAEHSSLDGVIRRATERLHFAYSPDPLPEEVIFIRSDQYSFVKEGIPAMMPSPGFASSDPKIAPMTIFEKWEETRYHQPQDDMDQPGLDFEAAAQYARFAFLCGYYITEDAQRPTWNKGDFFGEHYGPKSY
jgi:Zn-dependent M28 family amino/carboxypeptidase